MTSANGNYTRADVCLLAYNAVNRHLFLDVAIADPCCNTALSGPTSAAVQLAQLRNSKRLVKQPNTRICAKPSGPVSHPLLLNALAPVAIHL